jgi:hypothetical protein
MAAGVVLALASTASFAIPVSMPSCTSTTNWGSLGPPGNQAFGQAFTSAGSYNDCYNFSLGSNADSFGGTTAWDLPLNSLDINLDQVSLYSNTTMVGSDQSPESFAFAGLVAGGYTLVVSSVVTDNWGFYPLLAYTGQISTYKAGAGTTSVPEPTTLTLLGLGMVAAAAVRRRRRSNS